MCFFHISSACVFVSAAVAEGGDFIIMTSQGYRHPDGSFVGSVCEYRLCAFPLGVLYHCPCNQTSKASKPAFKPVECLCVP